MWQLFLLHFCFALSHQNTDFNCLRQNPAVLGVVSPFFQQEGQDKNVTAEELAESIFKISTRFRSLHISLTATSTYHQGTVKTIQVGMRLYKTKSTWNIPIFLYINSVNKTNDFSAEAPALRQAYTLIKDANSAQESPLITGIYTDLVMKDLDLYFELLESVFGSKEFSNLQIGYLDNKCQEGYRATYFRRVFFRIRFVTCIIVPTRQATPEKTADDVINLCNKFQNNAKSSNYSFEVVCLTGYPSQGKDIFLSSVDHFQRFWCRITNELAQNQSRMQILMPSAFGEDFPLFYLPSGRSEYQSSANRHLGWWRISSDRSRGFVEKVDELPGGSDYEKCTGECYTCNVSKNCCAEMICNSFHISQRGEPPRICRSQTSNCSRILEPSESDNQTLTVGALSTAGVFIAVLFAGAVGFLVYIRRNSDRVLTQHEICNFFDGLNLSSAVNATDDKDNSVLVDCLPYDKKMEVAKSECVIYEDQFLGSGAFGVVVKGRMAEDEVAVKTTICGVDKFYLRALMLELKVLMYIGQHEHIVSLLGAHTAELHAGKLFLFLEFCSFGNLLQFLRKRRHHFMENTAAEGFLEEIEGRRLTSNDLLQWSLQIASAMQHLEEKQVIHGDIAARNILVYSRDQVKLTDFGLSRRLYEHTVYVKSSQEPLPWRHMSVEALRDLSFSVQSDVWSFGVTMWEIFSLGDVPYPGYTWSQNFIQFLVEGLQPLCPDHANPLVFNIMASCWTLDVMQRPSITLVHSKLASVINSLSSD